MPHAAAGMEVILHTGDLLIIHSRASQLLTTDMVMATALATATASVMGIMAMDIRTTEAITVARITTHITTVEDTIIQVDQVDQVADLARVVHPVRER